MKKKLLVLIGAPLLFLLSIVFTLYLLTFAGAQSPSVNASLSPRLERVQDGIASIYLVDLGNEKLALIDAGNDSKGGVLLKALAARGKNTDDVVAIFITHSHPDHIGAIPLFPKATVYASKAEVPLAEGKQVYGSPISNMVGKFNAHPFSVGHPLEDGEKVALGDTSITAYTIPGHTAGSTAYLVHGALFTGDSINFRSGGKVGAAWWIFTNNVPEAKASLHRLADRLTADKAEVAAIVSAHTGSVAGLEPLIAFNRAQ